MPTSASPNGIAMTHASTRNSHGGCVRGLDGRAFAPFAVGDFGGFGGVLAVPVPTGAAAVVGCTTTGSDSRSRRRAGGGGAGSVADPAPRRGGGGPVPEET